MHIVIQFGNNVNSNATALTQVHTRWMMRGVQNVKSRLKVLLKMLMLSHHARHSLTPGNDENSEDSTQQ